jgi:hypothetical protein
MQRFVSGHDFSRAKKQQNEVRDLAPEGKGGEDDELVANQRTTCHFPIASQC